MLRHIASKFCLTLAVGVTAAEAQEFNIGQAYGDGETVYQMQYNGTWYDFGTVTTNVFTNYISSSIASTPWYMGADHMDGRSSDQGTKTSLAISAINALGYQPFSAGQNVYAYVAWDLNGDDGRDGFSQQSCNFFGNDCSPVAEDYDDDLYLYTANTSGNAFTTTPLANSAGTRTYLTATAIDAPTPVPEIDGSTIQLLAFIMGTIALGLRKRQSRPARADNHTPVAA